MQPAIEPSELRADRARTKPADAAKWAQWNRPVEIRALAAMFADPEGRHVGGPFEDVEPSMFHNPDTKTAINLLRNLDASGTPATLEALAERWKRENSGNFYDRGERLIAEIKGCEPERTPRGQAALATELQAAQRDLLQLIGEAEIDERDERARRTQAEEKPRRERRRVRKPAPNAREDLPVIRVGVKIPEVVDAAQDALLRAGGIYVRGTRLARVIRDRCTMDFLTVQDGFPLIAELGEAALCERMSAAADWEKYDGRSGSWKPTLPPSWAPRTLMERGEWTFPVLAGVSDTPVLRPDGTIHDVRGYDAASRMIFEPRFDWPAIKHNPTKHDANAAYHELCEPFCDIPFAAPHYRAAAIAYILTIIGRSAIHGPVPAFMSSSSTPGAGKGLSLDVGAIVATGHDAPKMLPTTNEEEMRKRLLPIAIGAPSTVVIDNVEGMFGSPSLAAALTSGSIEDRVLGESTNKRVPLRSVFGITGNNIQLYNDLGRRIIPIEIINELENPEDRKGFRYPALKGHVSEHRPRLVVAALTLLRAYIAAGMEKHDRAAKGSFEAWDRLVRGAIIWCASVDPCGGVGKLRKESDSDLDKLRRFVAAWLARPDLAAGCTTAELMRVASTDSSETTALRTAIAEYADSRKPMDGTVLGHRLKVLHRRPVTVGGVLYRIEHARGARAGVQCWRVVPRESWAWDDDEDENA